jgi:hypothetical protein
MNKRLEELLERLATWPPDAQEEAIASLESIEATANLNAGLSPAEQEAKLAALREMIHRSIERGGSYTPDDIDSMIDERFGDTRAQGR